MKEFIGILPAIALLVVSNSNAAVPEFELSTFEIKDDAESLRVDSNGIPFYLGGLGDNSSFWVYDENAAGERVGTTSGGFAAVELNGDFEYRLQPFQPVTQGYGIDSNGDILVAGYSAQYAASGPFEIRDSSNGELISVPIGSYRAPRINDSWDIVTGGVSGDDALFIYATGQTYSLAGLVANMPQNFFLGEATGINDALDMVGVGILNGTRVGWELRPLSPVPEAPTEVMLVVGGVLIYRKSRRDPCGFEGFEKRPVKPVCVVDAA